MARSESEPPAATNVIQIRYLQAIKKYYNLKLYKPYFSILVISIQLILSLIGHFQYLAWEGVMEKQNPELLGLINVGTTYETYFIFILLIGLYEMTTKLSRLKIFVRTLLILLVSCYAIAGVFPINNFRDGIYNTAWFTAIVALILILTRIGTYLVRKKLNRI